MFTHYLKVQSRWCLTMSLYTPDPSHEGVDKAEMSPTSLLRYLRHNKIRNVYGRCLLAQCSQEHQESIVLSQELHEKDTESCQREHSETMVFNREVLKSQQEMHKEMLEVQLERWTGDRRQTKHHLSMSA